MPNKKHSKLNYHQEQNPILTHLDHLKQLPKQIQHISHQNHQQKLNQSHHNQLPSHLKKH
nr:hypothetical protein [Staphylococcus epidermidis]